MRRLLVLIVLAGTLGFSQTFPGGVGYPGQGPYPPGSGPYPGGTGPYPPGQGPYPGGTGGPLPGGRRSRTPGTQAQQIETLRGVLQSISGSDLVLESEDKTSVTVSLSNSTKYYKLPADATKPVAAKKNDLQTGDHLSVEARKDDNNYFHATRVTLERAASDSDRPAASRSSDSGSTTPGDDDPDRPRLHRQPARDDGSRAPAPSQRAGNDASSTTTPQRAGNEASPATTPSQAATTVDPLPAHHDPDDDGPPVLRRGKPAPRQESSSPSGEPVTVAGTRPTVRAGEVNGATRLPEPPQATAGDPLIGQAREASTSFSETLPDYVVKQYTTRYETDAAHRGQTQWRAIDNVTADVVSEGGRETYRNLLVNGKAPREAIEKTGSWSTGEYTSVLQDILSPGTDADFHNKRSTTISNHPAFRYDFAVEKVNSHWTVTASAQSYVPEYTGSIWIDKETHRVLRIEMSARNVPKTFPLDTVESAVDYDFVQIGTGKFLLPVHAEALSCSRGTSSCSRNVIEFRNYRKFSAETSVTFDSTEPN